MTTTAARRSRVDGATQPRMKIRALTRLVVPVVALGAGRQRIDQAARPAINSSGTRVSSVVGSNTAAGSPPRSVRRTDGRAQ